MRKFLLLSLLVSLTTIVMGQTKAQKQKIIEATNVNVLQEIAEKADNAFKANKAKALIMAKEKGWVIQEEKDGRFYELVGVSEDGQPLYYTTFNVDAAESTRANTLHNGGLLGLNVEGQNMEAHVWDGGLARSTHQEYDGPGGTDRFSIGDGTSTLHYHSAHVTGTIIASGVDAAAKGMAPHAYAVGYEWNNDVSEATSAASSGMLISNHSYGYRADLIPDDYFGQYGSDAVSWDNLMYNAPYYLMVVAAGNDGNDDSSNGDPLDGNSAYDKLSGHATSKNNLVVANAQDANIDASGNLVSVSINSSSSEGPTDDYRIKPDITGNGTQVYSTYEDADDSYASITGTSMASPNVAGSLLLLQQHYDNLNGSYMKASTLKGLALHTADDAGDTGPDVIYGWGLMNTKKAAEVISNNNVSSIIEEKTLVDGSSYSTTVTASGAEDLVVSISWTDSPGTEVTGANDNTPVLVNDLDVIVEEGANTYYPYKLTSITTNTTGNNDVDPYERITIPAPTAGTEFTITVNHEGSLSTAQDYSLIVSGITVNTDLPLVNTTDITNIGLSTATSGGEVVDEGVSTVTERGIVYSTSPDPTTADNKITDAGSGTGSFVSNITGLSSSTTYYVKAYAVNSEGTAYGTQKTFTTLCDVISTLPFNEDFEGGTIPNCWDNDYGAANYGWEVGTDGSSSYFSIPSHTTYAYVNDDACNCDMSSVRLSTVPFDFTNYTNLEMTFESYAYNDVFTIQYSTDGGTTWSDLTSINANSAWTSETVDLSALDGNNSVILAFHYSDNSAWGYGWAIDDIQITGMASATYTATFTVTDASTSDPVSGATIDINSQILNTNSSGQATIDLPDGNYSYAINKNGYIESSGTVNISGSPVSENVSLTPYPPITFDTDVTDVTCNGSNDGQITTLNVTGGSGSGYEYSNDGGTTWQTSNIFSDLSGNDYTLQVKDDAANFSATQVVPVSEPDPINYDLNVNNVSAYGANDGSIEFTNVTGGNGTYEYTIDGGTNWQASATFTNLAPGDYTTQIKDQNSCLSGMQTVTITEPPQPNYTVTFTVTDADDGHPIDGASIDINSQNLSTNSSGQASIDLVDGNYPYSVTYSGYMSASGTVNISGAAVSENVSLTPYPPIAFDTDVTDVTCNGGSNGAISLINVSGGSGTGYEYSNDGGNTWQTSPNFTGLGAATYAMQVKDDAGNISTSVNVNINDPDAITYDLDINNVSAYGASDGIIEFTNVIGGNGIYEYSINSGTDWQASATFTDLAPGDYTAQVRDDIGCLSYTTTATITEPPQPTYTVTFTVLDANDSHAIDGATIEINSTTITTDGTGEATIDLYDGNYDYTVSKAGYQSATGTVTVNGAAVNEPVSLIPNDPITFSLNISEITCNGSNDGIIEFTDVAGGTGSGYEYSIDGGVTWETSPLFENLSPNDYAMHVKDSDGIISEPEPYSLGEPAEITFTVNVTDVSNYGGADGEIEVTAAGGTGALEYSIDGGTTWQASGIFTGLTAGDYNVVLTDANACITDMQAVTVNQPAEEMYTVTFVVSENGHPTDAATVDIDGNTLTTNTDGEAYIDLSDGNYAYTVTLNGYDNIDGTVIVSGSDITENIAFVGIDGTLANTGELYPNPTKGIVQITYPGTFDVTVLNALGKVVTTKEMNEKGELNLSNIAEGIYLVRIQSGNKAHTHRLIIKR